MPGVIGWNKARIMRIIGDERYLGTDVYPAILDAATFDNLRNIKLTRSSQNDTDRKADIFKISAPVICPQCGNEMHRRHDGRCKCRQRWNCTKKDCGERIVIADEDLLAKITETLNMVIVNPDQIKLPAKTKRESNIELRRTENEIARMLERPNANKDSLREKMLQCLSLKYMNIDDEYFIAKRMKTDFERTNPLTDFSAELTARTVKAITLNADGTVRLMLINNQIIGKELANHASSIGASNAT